MISHKMLRAGVALALLAGGVPAAAQAPDDPAAALSDYLRRLAASPRDIDALIGAGEAAVAAGDPRAAVTFFGRAEQIRPNEGRIKAGLGAAMVQLESPQQALDYFDQAIRLGVPDYQIGRDRGLAYDLLGNPRSAQQEYRLALQHGDDDELRRRLALSLAISGDRQGAMEQIDAQVRRQDRAGWRTRALVFALGGDVPGAMQTAAATIGREQAEAMRPFFTRLTSLTPAQRAMAVNFGEMPPDGVQVVSGFQSSAPPPLAADAVGQPVAAAPAPAPARTASTTPRRRPDMRSVETLGAQAASRAAVVPPRPRQEAAGPPVAPGQPVPLLPQPAPAATASAASGGPTRIASADPAPSPPPRAASPPPATVLRDPPKAPSFADVAASISGLSDDPAPAPKPATAAKPAARPEPEKKAPEKKPVPAKKPPPKPVEPSRHWVQLAGGANKGALPREYKKLQEKAPKLLGKRAAWTAQARATNRLLVGPFKDEGEVRAFINQLGKAGLDAFSWTSDEGQPIAKLGG